MLSLRVVRRLEAIRLLSVRRFQKLLGSYFLVAGLVVLMYFYLYGSENESSRRREAVDDRAVDDAAFAMASEALRSYDAEAAGENITAVIDKPETLIDILHKAEEIIDAAAAAAAVAAVDRPNTENTSAAVPDYVLESVVYAEDFSMTPSEEETTFLDTTNAFDADDKKLYALDKKGGVYEDILANYDDEAIYEIPHILHQTSDTELVPVQMASFMTSWIRYNPFWVHWFWTDRGFVSMLLSHFPEYYDIYRKYGHRINKSDMRKFFLLYKEGGFVADLDVECIRRFDDALLDSECILAREPEVHRVLLRDDPEVDYVTPRFMACRPGHPFMKYVIDNLRSYVEKPEPQPRADDEAEQNDGGTIFLTQMLVEYDHLYGTSNIYIAPAEFFMPAYDPAYETRLRVKCNGYKLDPALSERQRKLCEGLEQTDYKNFNLDNAYTYNHCLRAESTGQAINGSPADDAISVRNVLPAVSIFSG